jgi:hypothetical protein
LRDGLKWVLALLSIGCGGAEAHGRVDDSRARARQDSINRAQPGYIVDSILPPAEELRRFRDGLGAAPAWLTGGARRRDVLVLRFVRAVEARDTNALAQMLMSRAEFAYLLYPESRFAQPPYRQPPWLTWMLWTKETSIGLRRALDRYGGRTLGYSGYECDREPRVEGRNRLWTNCALRLSQGAADTIRIRLFGAIVERDGAFKFAGYGNGL